MTKLFIAYPQNAKVIDATYPTASTNYYYYNLLGGVRAAQFKTGSAATAVFTYQFPAATSINSLFIGSASEIINGDWSSSATDFDVLIESSIDGTSWTSRGTDTSVASFVGTMQTDYLLTFTSASAAYWRVTITPDANSEFKISKLFLCGAIDLGRDPQAIMHHAKSESNLYSVDGNLVDNLFTRVPQVINLIYTGITDAALASFLGILDVNERGYMALFSENNQLGGQGVIYGTAEDVTYSKVYTNFNNLSFNFNEQF